MRGCVKFFAEQKTPYQRQCANYLTTLTPAAERHKLIPVSAYLKVAANGHLLHAKVDRGSNGVRNGWRRWQKNCKLKPRLAPSKQTNVHHSLIWKKEKQIA